jgi:hypothetical protein
MSSQRVTWKDTGFRGSFTTFGSPIVRHGDRVKLVDPVINDRNGFYIVKSVETSFGQNGYRQKRLSLVKKYKNLHCFFVWRKVKAFLFCCYPVLIIVSPIALMAIARLAELLEVDELTAKPVKMQ